MHLALSFKGHTVNLGYLTYALSLPVEHRPRLVVSVSTSRSRDVPTSRLGFVWRKIVNVSVSSREADVSVSAIYVSYPRPIFGQIVQATVRSVNGL